MAKQYDNNNTGVLFKNDEKKDDKHPDYKGSAEVDGVEYWVSGWIKTGGKQSKLAGQKFLSLRYTPKEEANQGNGKQSAKPSGRQRQAEEDVPF